MKRAYGFKKPKYLKTIIYLVASDMDLPTPKNFAKLQSPTHKVEENQKIRPLSYNILLKREGSVLSL